MNMHLNHIPIPRLYIDSDPPACIGLMSHFISNKIRTPQAKTENRQTLTTTYVHRNANIIILCFLFRFFMNDIYFREKKKLSGGG